MKISVVIPVYNEEKSLGMLDQNLKQALKNVANYEVIYVDDGSSDKSLSRLEKIAENNSCVKIVSLARNYGQTQAIAAGIDHAQSEIIVTMDADLQNDPVDICRLLAKLEEGFDVVSGWRVNRKDSLWRKKIPSYIANKISASITSIKLHDLGCTLKCYRKKILEKIEFYGEIHRLLPLYAAAYGAKIAEIPVKHHRRKYGKSKYGISRVFKVILDMLTLMFMWKFTTKPIYVFGGMGIFSLCISTLVGMFIIIRKIFFCGVWVSPLLFIFAIFAILGAQFILMGVLAELVIRLYYGTRNQKRYIVRKIWSKEK